MKYDQIAELLNGIAERFDWEKEMEGDNIIGLKQVLHEHSYAIIITIKFMVKRKGLVTSPFIPLFRQFLPSPWVSFVTMVETIYLQYVFCCQKLCFCQLI